MQKHNEPKTVIELKAWIDSLPDSMPVVYVPNFQVSSDDAKDRSLQLVVTAGTLYFETGSEVLEK